MAIPHLNQIIQGDCRVLMRELPENCISACITDPPYSYEFIGREWNHAEIERRLKRVADKSSSTLVKHIPYGSGLAGGVRNERWYERNRQNLRDYRAWCQEWAGELIRVMRPGAFALVFNSSRTAAHVQVAMEEAGFYARDCLVWRRHAGIPKGLNIAKKLNGNAAQWEGWHSALRNEWEAIIVCQKPLAGNYIKTLQVSGVGVFRAIQEDGSFQSTIIEGIQRDKADKINGHCTVKPLSLIKKLIRLVVPSQPGHVILDPFAGSGTTALAAKLLSHQFIGYDLVEDYCYLARGRLA